MSRVLPVVHDPCPRCSKLAEDEPHSCPYAQEINDDHETECTCCEECEHECLMDI